MMNESTIAVPVTEYDELIKARVERDFILESYVKDNYPSLTDKIIELIKGKIHLVGNEWMISRYFVDIIEHP